MAPTSLPHITRFESLRRAFSASAGPSPVPLTRSFPVAEIRPDLNTVLANVARTFDQKARLCRRQEAEALAAIDKPESVYIREGYRQDAERAAKSAEAWEARAAEAEAGYFLARVSEELNDAAFIQEFGDVMTVCQAEGRAVYQSTVQAQRMQQDSAGASSV